MNSLTEREKEVLRLLAASHDAKSAAAHLGLSVHTINERLRAARRKLGVSSSRAAARVLAGAETGDPQNLVDKDFGGDPVPVVVNDVPLAARRRVPSQGWLVGGLLMLVVALAMVIALTGRGPNVADGGGDPPTPDAAVSPSHSPPAAELTEAVVAGPAQFNAPALIPAPQDAAAYALEWLELVDRGDWKTSWRTASSTFQGRMSEDAWTARAAQFDRPSGPLVRVQQYAARSAPASADADGSVLVQYQSSSDTGEPVLETVALVPDGGEWKVSAYFTHRSPPGPATRPTP